MNHAILHVLRSPVSTSEIHSSILKKVTGTISPPPPPFPSHIGLKEVGYLTDVYWIPHNPSNNGNIVFVSLDSSCQTPEGFPISRYSRLSAHRELFLMVIGWTCHTLLAWPQTLKYDRTTWIYYQTCWGSCKYVYN